MRKAKIRGALSFLAMTWCLVGQVAAQEVAPGVEQEKKEDVFVEGAYIVQDGDTLWAISSRYLDNPRLWPQIWKENAFVSDPDMIFPGDPLVIPGVTPPPKPVAEAPPVPPIAEERVEPPVAPPVEAPPVEAPLTPAPPEVAEVEKPEKVIVGLVAPPSGTIPRPALECSGFVAKPEEIHAVGQIIRSLEEFSTRLWYADHVFLDLGGQKVQPGDRFWIIRPSGTIKHPVTGRRVGIKVRTLGTVEIVNATGPNPWAKIIYNCEDIAPGDALVDVKTWAHPPKGLDRSADLRVGGYIIGSKSGSDALGQFDIVYVDIGQEKGIIPGDEFAIYQRAGIAVHPTKRRTVPLAPLKRGELVVIRTSAQSAVGLVTKSDLTLRVGEGIVLQRQMP
ncbi:MAG: LysM peptidoglycan-binding domain-containing protein [candidate division NC10 bacterium]